jgi:hypothetical protein
MFGGNYTLGLVHYSFREGTPNFSALHMPLRPIDMGADAHAQMLLEQARRAKGKTVEGRVGISPRGFEERRDSFDGCSGNKKYPY